MKGKGRNNGDGMARERREGNNAKSVTKRRGGDCEREQG